MCIIDNLFFYINIQSFIQFYVFVCSIGYLSDGIFCLYFVESLDFPMGFLFRLHLESIIEFKIIHQKNKNKQTNKVYRDKQLSLMKSILNENLYYIKKLLVRYFTPPPKWMLWQKIISYNIRSSFLNIYKEHEIVNNPNYLPITSKPHIFYLTIY